MSEASQDNGAPTPVAVGRAVPCAPGEPRAVDGGAQGTARPTFLLTAESGEERTPYPAPLGVQADEDGAHGVTRPTFPLTAESGAERTERRTCAGELHSEFLILSDGTILAHNLTPAMAAVLKEVSPGDERVRLRDASGADAPPIGQRETD